VTLPSINPCPFCGTAASLCYAQGNENVDQCWWVRCDDSDCAAKGRGFYGSNTWGGPGNLKAIDAKAQRDAIEHWNRRPKAATDAIAPTDGAVKEAYRKALRAVNHSRTIYEAETYLQRFLDSAPSPEAPAVDEQPVPIALRDANEWWRTEGYTGVWAHGDRLGWEGAAKYGYVAGLAAASNGR